MDKYLKTEQNYLKNNSKNTMFTASITCGWEQEPPYAWNVDYYA